MISMRLLTPHQVQLTQAMHLFITTKGMAAMEGTALGDDDQTPKARPTQAIWINATTGTDIIVDPDPEWMAIHYSLDCAGTDPTLTEWQTRWAAEANCLDEVTLDDMLTPQKMEPAGRTPQSHLDPTKHTLWHYPTTIHPEAVTRIKVALSLTLPDSHNTHQLGMFTKYWKFPTDTGMVPKVAEPPLPPDVTALAKAAQATALREGTRQDWTPNVLVEQRAQHNANEAQRAGRQIHRPLHVDLQRWRVWRRLGEREQRWRGLGVEDGYGRRGERRPGRACGGRGWWTWGGGAVLGGACGSGSGGGGDWGWGSRTGGGGNGKPAGVRGGRGWLTWGGGGAGARAWWSGSGERGAPGGRGGALGTGAARVSG